MNKILGLVMGVFVFALMAGMASAVPMTLVSGEVLNADNSPAIGVDVDVTCTHNTVDTMKTVQTNSLGKYFASFGSTECNTGDYVVAHTDGAEDNSGNVTDNSCRIGTLVLNLQIPEFGVIAGAVALIGALGIFMYRRNN